jgi:hypothetical protein
MAKKVEVIGAEASGARAAHKPAADPRLAILRQRTGGNVGEAALEAALARHQGAQRARAASATVRSRHEEARASDGVLTAQGSKAVLDGAITLPPSSAAADPALLAAATNKMSAGPDFVHVNWSALEARFMASLFAQKEDDALWRALRHLGTEVELSQIALSICRVRSQAAVAKAMAAGDLVDSLKRLGTNIYDLFAQGPADALGGKGDDQSSQDKSLARHDSVGQGTQEQIDQFIAERSRPGGPLAGTAARGFLTPRELDKLSADERERYTGLTVRNYAAAGAAGELERVHREQDLRGGNDLAPHVQLARNEVDGMLAQHGEDPDALGRMMQKRDMWLGQAQSARTSAERLRADGKESEALRKDREEARALHQVATLDRAFIKARGGTDGGRAALENGAGSPSQALRSRPEADQQRIMVQARALRDRSAQRVAAKDFDKLTPDERATYLAALRDRADAGTELLKDREGLGPYDTKTAQFILDEVNKGLQSVLQKVAVDGDYAQAVDGLVAKARGEAARGAREAAASLRDNAGRIQGMLEQLARLRQLQARS